MLDLRGLITIVRWADADSRLPFDDALIATSLGEDLVDDAAARYHEDEAPAPAQPESAHVELYRMIDNMRHEY